MFFIRTGAIVCNTNWYMCLDIMPLQEGMLPILKHIFEWRCTVHSDIHVYLLIHCMWRYSKKDKSTIVLELRAKNYLRIELLRTKLAENFGKNGHPPPPPLKESIYFFHKKRTDYFQHFEGQNIHFHKVPAHPPPPPSQNQMVVP